MLDLKGVQDGIFQAIKEMPGLQRQRPSQQQVWLGVRQDPQKLMAYVKERTGASGDELLRQMDAYSQEMTRRYGT